MNRLVVTLILLVTGVAGMAQVDSLATRQLDEVTVKAYRFTMERMSTTMGTRMFGNKKNEVIQVQSLDANISEKTPRQIFAKVPGVFVYDMDGTGNQTNISTRGLDPHRAGGNLIFARTETLQTPICMATRPVISVCPWKPSIELNWCVARVHCNMVRSLGAC